MVKTFRRILKTSLKVARSLARATGLILQARHGRDDLFSAPPDPDRRDDIGSAARACRAHARRALRPRSWRAVADRHPRFHAGGRRGRVVAACDRWFFRRLFYRDAD